MARTIGVLIFDDAEEMDFVGPWEVLRAAADLVPGERVVTVAAASDRPITCQKGLRVIPDVSYDDCPPLDIVVVPGGGGARREVDNPATVEWLRGVAEGCDYVTSVCTGSFLLAGAGLAEGKRITTHHNYIDMLRERGGAAEVLEGVRMVRDGNLITAGGVSSGIEMSLWLVKKLYGDQVLAKTKSYIAYDYPPRKSVEFD